MRLSGIVVAAGSSRRMGFDKLLAEVCGRPVLWHTLRRLAGCGEIEGLVVVAEGERAERVREWAAAGEIGAIHAVVAGGAERAQSVRAGLAALPGWVELVAVHDGARPVVDAAVVRACAARAAEVGAAACARPVVETLKRGDEAGWVVGSVSREGLWAMETPQIFWRELLERAYRELEDGGELGGLVTDEVTAVERLGAPVALVRVEGLNPKVTYPGDLGLVELLLGACGHGGLAAGEERV
jgi:2-C-methyl-D-erythritol 4-phosphate cytidylyltransferase